MESKYNTCLAYFANAARDLEIPDLGMVKVMFMHKKQEALAEASRLKQKQAQHELTAREAYTRLTLYTQANATKGE